MTGHSSTPTTSSALPQSLGIQLRSHIPANVRSFSGKLNFGFGFSLQGLIASTLLRLHQSTSFNYGAGHQPTHRLINSSPRTSGPLPTIRRWHTDANRTGYSISWRTIFRRTPTNWLVCQTILFPPHPGQTASQVRLVLKFLLTIFASSQLLPKSFWIWNGQHHFNQVKQDCHGLSELHKLEV